MKGYTTKYPAVKWQDALPSGNGNIGALVFGMIRDEQIILNHDRLYLDQEKPTIEPMERSTTPASSGSAVYSAISLRLKPRASFRYDGSQVRNTHSVQP